MFRRSYSSCVKRLSADVELDLEEDFELREGFDDIVAEADRAALSVKSEAHSKKVTSYFNDFE